MSNSNEYSNSSPQDEVSLTDLAARLWARRLLVFLVTATCVIGAAVVSFMLPVKYEASVVLAPISDDGDAGRFSGVSSLFSQYGGLSALGGFNFSTSSKKSEALATLQSRALIMTYIKEKDLLPVLFPRNWDAAEKRWKNDKPPTLQSAQDFFSSGVMKVVDDKKTGLIRMTMLWTDPELATQWANDLIARTNQYLRQKASEQSARNITYLNDQLTRTSVVELQKAIYSLTEAEIKKVMVAQGSDEYAFKIIDPALVPEHKAKPDRKLIVIAGFIAGLIISFILVLILELRAGASRAVA